MSRKLPIFLLVVVAGAVAYVLTRPTLVRVERSVVVRAPPATVFPRVASLREWPAWSPWEHIDPKMKVEYSGPESGEGQVYSWKGDDRVGEGRMTVTKLVPDRLVRIRLEFVKPWEATSDTELALEGVDGGTRVTWSMTVEQDLAGKLFSVFRSLDAAVGPDFERGLASLRQVSGG